MADEQDRLIARAIESVLDQVPGSIDTSVPEEGSAAKLQPWAETAAPVGRNKRPLEELLAELEQRVAADPQAQATLPRTRHPALAFFDRFGRVPQGRPDGGAPAGDGTGRRRRRRRGGGGAPVAQPAGAAPVPAPSQPEGRPPGSRRRSRRGRGRGGGGGAPAPAGAPPRQDAPAAATPPRAPGSGGRRRRGRRGRGGERPPAA